LPVIGDMALKRYTSQNRPPKIILFYFCSWDLDYGHAVGARLFEGEEMLARHGSWGAIVRFAVAHPSELFSFPFRVYSSLGFSSLKHLLSSRQATQEVSAFRGHVANSSYFPPLPSDCTIPASDIADHGTASVRALMAKYSTPQTKTMLYLAPAPGCRNAQELLDAISANLQTAPPAVLPPSSFTADGYYAHVLPNAVTRATELAAAAVRPFVNAK
jgi:hypothetical protein